MTFRNNQIKIKIKIVKKSFENTKINIQIKNVSI